MSDIFDTITLPEQKQKGDIFDQIPSSKTEQPKDIFDNIAPAILSSFPNPAIQIAGQIPTVKSAAAQTLRRSWKIATTPVSEQFGAPTLGKIADVNIIRDFANAPSNEGGLAKAGRFTKNYLTGLGADVSDILQTPISYIPIPGAKLLGKIPVGETTLSAIAKTIPVTKTFFKDIRELQRLEATLKKTTPLSSRGITDVAIKRTIEDAGGKFLEVQPAAKSMYGEDTVWYNTPSGSTQSVPVSKMTPELIQEKINTFETAYKKGQVKKDLESANKKLLMRSQVDKVHQGLGEKANDPAIQKRLNDIEARNQLTPQEEQALVNDIKGVTEPPIIPKDVFDQVAPAPVGKERGFITSVKESPQVPGATKEAVGKLQPERTTYDPYSDQAALTKAQQRVSTDPEGALAEVMSADVPTKDTAVTGLELMRRARTAGNTEMEVNIAQKLAEKATTGGQFIQAFSILDKLSPEGVLVMAGRQLGNKLSPELAQALQAQAAKIANMPYGWYKMKEIQKLMEMIAEQKGRSASDWVTELMNVPRTITAGLMDFSFGGRQGAFFLPSFTKEWAAGFKKQFGSFISEGKYDELMDSIVKHPDFQLAQESGVSFTQLSSKAGRNLSRVEERYMGGGLTEQIPIIGKGIKMTERAYNAMANKMRIDIFAKMDQDLLNVGLDMRTNEKLAKQIATFVNAGTGRGGLKGSLAKAAGLLNAFFFSPRLMSSRLTLLNPAYYVTREPGLRKQSLKSLFSFIGLGTTILGTAHMSGLEVGIDPRSADFGKIKIGNTRIDIWGGFSQYVRAIAQQISGQYVSSTTGRILTLGEGYKPLTRYDIFMRQIESKEAPVFSLLTTILKQQTWDGKLVDVPKEIGIRFVPMVMQDMYDLAQEDPELIPIGALSVFGMGVNTYSDKKMDAVRDGVKKLNNSGNLNTISREVANKVHESPTPAQIRNIRKDILQEQVINKNPYYLEMVSAGTNDQKIKVLKKMREEYGAEEMRKYELEMLRTKMVSPEVIYKSRRP